MKESKFDKNGLPRGPLNLPARTSNQGPGWYYENIHGLDVCGEAKIHGPIVHLTIPFASLERSYLRIKTARDKKRNRRAK